MEILRYAISDESEWQTEEGRVIWCQGKLIQVLINIHDTALFEQRQFTLSIVSALALNRTIFTRLSFHFLGNCIFQTFHLD